MNDLLAELRDMNNQLTELQTKLRNKQIEINQYKTEMIDENSKVELNVMKNELLVSRMNYEILELELLEMNDRLIFMKKVFVESGMKIKYEEIKAKFESLDVIYWELRAKKEKMDTNSQIERDQYQTLEHFIRFEIVIIEHRIFSLQHCEFSEKEIKLNSLKNVIEFKKHKFNMLNNEIKRKEMIIFDKAIKEKEISDIKEKIVKTEKEISVLTSRLNAVRNNISSVSNK